MTNEKLLDAIPLPSGEPVAGKTYLADGWVYRDLPNMTVTLFDEFIELVGESNLVWLTKAERRWADGAVTKRGQILISPDGIKRITAHAALTDREPQP